MSSGEEASTSSSSEEMKCDDEILPSSYRVTSLIPPSIPPYTSDEWKQQLVSMTISKSFMNEMLMNYFMHLGSSFLAKTFQQESNTLCTL